jgi:hypothetical protein
MQAFLDSFANEIVWAQVLIARDGSIFRLRHVEDRATPSEELKLLSTLELRRHAMFNAAGQFRPLHSAPDLRTGWRTECHSAADLWRALQELYPGSIPDWFAALNTPPPVTNYRDYTNRQSGMYRITQALSDTQAAHVIRACCPPAFCLKRRFWTVEGLPPDAPETKSKIPCLEACAILLELARKASRIEQEESVGVQTSDLQSLLAAARSLLQNGQTADRTGKIGSPTNPRRLQLVLEKYADAVNDSPSGEE